ncbi:MAG TPA: S4 domain-containing protein, partial [Galbitalea sp.]
MTSDSGEGRAPASSSASSPASSPASDDGERLQKVMAAAGVASRRVSENLISAGRVSVNGEVVTELGRRVQPSDLVSVD